MKSGGPIPEGQVLVQLATFHVGGQEYALDIMQIKEIINPVPIRPVPKAPRFIEGVIELRGSIIPILDLRKRFDLLAPPPARSTKYIIVAIDGRIVGLVVDAIGEVLRLASGEVRATPSFVEDEAAAYFTGVCHHAGRIIMILGLDRVLSTHEKISLAGLAARLPDGGAA